MKRGHLIVAAVAIGVTGAAAVRLRAGQRPADYAPECCRTSSPNESAGLCPWRSQTADRLSLFPGSNRSEQKLLALSDLRPEILRRLGHGAVTDGNALYIYRVYEGSQEVGVVLVQRAPGQFGAIEYVLGMTRDGHVRGLRIQSQREPDTIAAAITSPKWLGAFAGKTANDGFSIGADLPEVPAGARPTATALASSVRRLVVEATVGEARGRG